MSDWHSDDEQDRLIALSINLGRSPYEGGVLQIRRASGATMLGEVETRERRTQGGIGLRPIFAR